MSVRIFINYRREANLREAQHLATLLAAKFGKSSVFLDLRGIGGAENWMEKLQEQVDACDVMLVLIEKNWAQATNAQGQRRMEDANDPLVYEISRALRNRMPVLPILIDSATMPEAAELPKSVWVLTLQHGMPLRNEFFGPDTSDIVAAIKRRIKEQGRRRKTPAWALSAAALTILASGIAAGPLLLVKLGLPLPGIEAATAPNANKDPREYSSTNEAIVRRIGGLSSFASNLSFMDADTKSSLMPAGDAQLINQAIEAAMQKLASVDPNVVINTPSHTLVNNDRNTKRLNDIFWDPNLSKTEKVDKIINEIMIPAGIDLLLSGQYQEKVDGSVILRPFVIKKRGKDIQTESKTFTRSEFNCTDPNNKNKVVICAKAVDDIGDIVVRLLSAPIEVGTSPSSAPSSAFISNISFMDAETKSVMAAGDAELINLAIEAGMQKLSSTKPRAIINAPGHTLMNNDANAKKLNDIFWEPNLSKTEKIDKIIKEMMAPAGINLLVAGQYQQKRDDSVILRPFVIDRFNKDTRTESRTFTRSEFDCTDPTPKTKMVICAKAIDEISDIAVRLLAPLIPSQPDGSPNNEALLSTIRALTQENAALRNRIKPFISNLTFMDTETKSIMPARDAELLNEAVEEGMQKLASTNTNYIINAPSHTLVNNDSNAKKLNDTFWDPNLSRTEKADKIINEMLMPAGIDLLVAGQYQKKVDGTVILRPFLISRLDAQTRTETITFPKTEFTCTDPKNRSRTIICGKAVEKIKEIVVRLLKTAGPQ